MGDELKGEQHISQFMFTDSQCNAQGKTETYLLG